MKKNIFFYVFSLFIIFSSNTYCQLKEKVVEVIKPQIICVNSVTALSGSTRKVISVHLPPNTIRWYYSYSAFRNKQEIERVNSNFNLLSKLSFIVDQTGTTASAITLLGQPPGNDYCDIYLLNSAADVRLFENKSDYSGNQFYYNRQGSREGLVSGIIDIDDSSRQGGWQYIGLRNNDFNTAVNVLLQVVAIVSVEPTSNGWSASRKQQTYLHIKNIITKSSGTEFDAVTIDNLTICLMGKITKEYNPDQLSTLAEYEFKPIITRMGEECLKEQNLIQN